jgi:hypothetical protein
MRLAVSHPTANNLVLFSNGLRFARPAQETRLRVVEAIRASGGSRPVPLCIFSKQGGFSSRLLLRVQMRFFRFDLQRKRRVRAQEARSAIGEALLPRGGGRRFVRRNLYRRAVRNLAVPYAQSSTTVRGRARAGLRRAFAARASRSREPG